MKVNGRFIKGCCMAGFSCFIFTLNAFAGLTESEREELDGLQISIEKDVEVTEKQRQRWEELLLKDPENLKKIRQKEIDNWKAKLMSEGKEIDQAGIERKLEEEWQDFLVKKDKAIINLNEQNVVLFLRQIREACRIENQNKETYPPDLNTLILNNQANIQTDLYVKVKKIYNIRYEKTSENYRVLAFPLNPGQTGNKNFLLDNEIIFFTGDGSIPTLNSNRIL